MKLTPLSNAAILTRLGERIREARLHANITQAQLADQAGVSVVTVKRAESGKSNTSLLTWIALLRALGHLEQLAPLLTSAPLQPLEKAAERAQPRRQRATGERAKTPESQPWKWGDEK